MAATSEAERKRPILVYYDGSAESTRALDRVVEIASAVPSDVTVVSVAEPLYPAAPSTGYADPIEAERHRRLLDNATQSLAVHAARERQAQRNLVQHLLSESVADELVAEAEADVLVAR